MNKGYFSKLAIGNLQKNGRFYLPYILTQAGLLASFYIIMTLAMDDRLGQVKGGSYIPTFMVLGVIVMVILSTILIIYMNSFLMRQRKHEFGLYNILGMEKRHVCCILLRENLFSNGVAILLGLVSGIIFYKLSILLICRLLGVDSVLGFYYIRPISILPTVGFFVLLDILLYGLNCINIYRMKPVELLQSKKAGEKEPKTNWLLFIPGIIALGLGYYQALTCTNPLQAINIFFSAVLLVILGTYCLFVAGSIWILRLLKANKKYYYNKKHMIGVSGLLYRMRQNAVGLASITILACGVLVMISTTISLYAGTEETLRKSFPDQIQLTANYYTEDGALHFLTEEDCRGILTEQGAKYGLTLKNIHEEHYLEVTYLLKDQELVLSTPGLADAENLAVITFLSSEEYEKMTGSSMKLGASDIAICSYEMRDDYPADHLKIGDKDYTIAERLDIFPIPSSYIGLSKCYGIVLPTEEALQTVYEAQHDFYPVPSELTNHIQASYNENPSRDKGAELIRDIWNAVSEYFAQQPGAIGVTNISGDNVWETATEMYGMYSALLFLGLILGFVFLFATALIIYYKQISEGYEDRDRFQIMSRIGLSEAEAKKAISGQILLVFFLPLVVSGIHLAAAYPLLDKLLRILQLGSPELFVRCTLLAYAGFAIIYTSIYVMTAKIYYRIVS